jgi:hypothetical protein
VTLSSEIFTATYLLKKTKLYLSQGKRIFHYHHHRLNSPTWALAFLRSFCQVKYPAIASSDFVTRVFSRVELSAPHPTPGYPGGSMFSVSVVSLR